MIDLIIKPSNAFKYYVNTFFDVYEYHIFLYNYFYILYISAIIRYTLASQLLCYKTVFKKYNNLTRQANALQLRSCIYLKKVKKIFYTKIVIKKNQWLKLSTNWAFLTHYVESKANQIKKLKFFSPPNSENKRFTIFYRFGDTAGLVIPNGASINNFCTRKYCNLSLPQSA